MGITDIYHKNGKMKNGKGVADAVYWTEMQSQMKDLTWQQFKEVVFPIIEHFTEEGN